MKHRCATELDGRPCNLCGAHVVHGASACLSVKGTYDPLSVLCLFSFSVLNCTFPRASGSKTKRMFHTAMKTILDRSPGLDS